jgi:hypothetical protein
LPLRIPCSTRIPTATGGANSFVLGPAVINTHVEDQLRIYSMQSKHSQNVFGKGRQALSGKVGGMKDDVAIALQLGIYYSTKNNCGRTIQEQKNMLYIPIYFINNC